MVKRAWDEWPGRDGEPDDDGRSGIASLRGRPPRLATNDGETVMPGLPGGPQVADPYADWQEIPTGDGGVIVRMGGPELLTNDDDAYDETADNDGFYDNLALTLDESILANISQDLLEGIEADIRSMSVWMANYERGMAILGLEMKQPRGEATGEGVSVVDHPLLLEACILEQSNASAELLPAGGPVKIDNGGEETAITDEDAKTLERNMNIYLTVKRPEYYPDSEQMFFQRGYGGMGFKKVFHCPIRRAPVSDSVAPGDLIVSNNAKSLEDASRVTHRIKMRPALMKRMMFLGEYRDVALGDAVEDTTVIEQKTANIQGIRKQTERPQDTDYTVYECCCEIDMPGDEHKARGKSTGLPRPYIVTIEKDSRAVLDIRRNWVRDDELFTARRRYIAFPYLPMFGFYASGLLTVLGNTTSALTAGWRIMIDSGMFANFPGGMYLKGGNRQLDNNFRAAPGEFVPVDSTGTDDIRKTIMPYPYKEPGPATQQFFEKVEATGQRVGATTQIPVAEGRADAPVGTTLAALEQAAKMIAATHRRAHQSQSVEFQTLLELIREAPEDFIKFFEDEGYWTAEKLLKALDNYTLIPRADPNTPTQMHRIIKAMGLKQLEQLSPDRYDGQKVDAHIMRTALGIDDPQEFFAPPAAPGAMPPDPTLAVANLVAQTEAAKNQSRERVELQKNQIKQAEIATNAQLKAHEIATRAELERQKIQSTESITEFKENAATERSLLDQQHQAVEGEASRQHTQEVASERNKTSLDAVRMRPKPSGGSNGSKK